MVALFKKILRGCEGLRLPAMVVASTASSDILLKILEFGVHRKKHAVLLISI
jgi:hypothetical protein